MDRSDDETKAPESATPARDRLWDANDVARFLRVSRSWVYNQAAAGRLPCIRLGALLRFSPSVIRALTEALAFDPADARSSLTRGR